MKDGFGREIDYMRISITDRCNLRCRYCMPEGISWVPMEEILTFEEIEVVVKEAATLGIKKIKVTGGEPLARIGCPTLVGMLKKVPGIEKVILWTKKDLKRLPEGMNLRQCWMELRQHWNFRFR